MSHEIKQILVVGAGVMGSSIAQVFAANGYPTVMADVDQASLDRATARIDANMAGLTKAQLIDSAYIETVHRNLSTMLSSEIAEHGKQFDLVAESVYESPKVKADVYQMLSSACRQDCIFASNTSAMDVFTVTKGVVSHPERMAIVHWFNPPHLMKLVEIVKGPETSEETVDTAKAVMLACGKKPVVLNTYVPGFIVNRMATVICRELLYMVEQGWVSPQDLDTALRYTDGLRWSFEGPLELVDYVGLEIPRAVAGEVLPSLCNDEQGISYLDKLISEGKTGVKAGEGIMGKYPADMEETIAKRNRRIIQMIHVMNSFEQEDEQ